MSVWQFVAACDGYAKGNDPNGNHDLSPAEADELWSWMQTKH
jgi:hypothetical protein